jgi:protein-disulfide isomerase
LAAGVVVVLAMSLSGRTAARAAGPRQSPRDTGGSGIETVDVRLKGDAAWLGDPHAAVSIVEFADFFCPYCAKHAASVLTALREGPVRTGRVRYAFRQTPLTAIHPRAQAASEAAVCAGEQGAFWKMHDLLFAQVRTAAQIDHLVLARSLNLDDGRYRSCLDGRGKAAVAIEANEAASLGVEGTPTFFVGRTMPDGSVRGYRRLTGARDYDAFQLAIQEVERGTRP